MTRDDYLALDREAKMRARISTLASIAATAEELVLDRMPATSSPLALSKRIEPHLPDLRQFACVLT